MSLVNDMLLDLEQRRGSAAGTLQGVRAAAVNATPQRPPRRGVIMLAFAALVTGAALLGYRGWDLGLDGRDAMLAEVPLPLSPHEQGKNTDPEPVLRPENFRQTSAAKLAVVIPQPDSSPAITGFNRYRLDYRLAQPPRSRPQPAVARNTTIETAVDATASVAVVVPASKQQVPDAPTRATTPAVSIRQADPVTQLRKRVVTALQQRRPSVAERAARDWLVRQPGNADAQLLLQQALVEQGRVDAAIAHLRASLTNTDAPVRVATALAHQLLAAGDDAAALTVLQQYRHNAAANLEFQALLAAVFERTGDYPAAFDRYGYLVTQRPQQGAWWVGLAISSEALGRRGDARAAYQTARSVENLDPALARYASERLAQLGDKQ